ncbi:MAG: DinB family protein [Micromonosporaceae bacterium]
MTWTAPEIARPDIPFIADERAMLESWLDFHRQTLLHKCAGLTPEQLKQRAVPPSSMSLLGLVRHMADVERWSFRRNPGEALDPIYWDTDNSGDADFDEVDTADPEADFAVFHNEVEAARKAAADRTLDDAFRSKRGNEISMRWVYAHMIEEYARHNGHADLLRECIDGATGT